MNKTTRIVFCVALTFLLLGAYFVVSANGNQPAGPSRSLTGLNFPPPPSEVNKGNQITTGTPYATLVAGFNIEDSNSFLCGAKTSQTCTYVANSFATSSGGGTANDDRALCLVVDGNIVGACAYNGYDAADGSYSAISSVNSTVVTPGMHTAYMMFYTTYGTTMYTYTNVYSVYKP